LTERPLRVLIVSENISLRLGGESSLGYYYATLFDKRNVEVWLACNARVRESLAVDQPSLHARTFYAEDTAVQRFVEMQLRPYPGRVRDLFVGQGLRVSTQVHLRAIARKLAREGKIDVVFEPSPIAPKGLSFMYDIGVPVVIGPLCGGMNFPPAFRDMDSFAARHAVEVGRRASDLAHRMIPGKIQADVLLVANEATERALPSGYRGRVIRVFESGVDLDLWAPDPPAGEKAAREAGARFVFSGRFVDWKGIQFLLPAFKEVLAEVPECSLEIIGGEGPLAPQIHAQAGDASFRGRVRIHGWLQRPEAAAILRSADVFVMPSLRECGGTAILEAMAMGKAVITTDWGGPRDYVTEGSGLLVAPTSKQDFVSGLARAMTELARSPERRRALGARAMQRVREDHLDWESKADRVLSILKEAARDPTTGRGAAGPPAEG